MSANQRRLITSHEYALSVASRSRNEIKYKGKNKTLKYDELVFTARSGHKDTSDMGHLFMGMIVAVTFTFFGILLFTIGLIVTAFSVFILTYFAFFYLLANASLLENKPEYVTGAAWLKRQNQSSTRMRNRTDCPSPVVIIVNDDTSIDTDNASNLVFEEVDYGLIEHDYSVQNLSLATRSLNKMNGYPIFGAIDDATATDAIDDFDDFDSHCDLDMDYDSICGDINDIYLDDSYSMMSHDLDV